MSTLCLPHVLFPQHIITQQQMIEHLQQLHRDHPQLALAARMIRNTEVRQRHLLLPIEALTAHRGIARRSELYEQEARRMSSVQPVRLYVTPACARRISAWSS